MAGGLNINNFRWHFFVSFLCHNGWPVNWAVRNYYHFETQPSMISSNLSHDKKRPSARRTHGKLSPWVLRCIYGSSQPNVAIYATIMIEMMTLLPTAIGQSDPWKPIIHQPWPSLIGGSRSADDKATNCLVR